MGSSDIEASGKVLLVLFILLLLCLSQRLRGAVPRKPSELDSIGRGYEKFGKHRAWSASRPGFDYTVLPKHMLYPLRNDSRLDFRSVAEFHMQARYTNSHQNPQFVKSIHMDLNKNLGSLCPRIIEEAQAGLAAELALGDGQEMDWRAKHPKEIALRLTARIISRLTVGDRIEITDQWLDRLIQYPSNIFVGGVKVLQWPALLRPIAQYFIPEFRRIRETRQHVLELLAPVYQEARKEQQGSGPRSIPGCLNSKTLMSWIWRNSRDQDRSDAFQTQMVLFTTLPALYTTALGTAQAIIDLASFSDYLPMIREEFESALEECDGALTREAIDKMEKLDSFIKESQRLNPLSLVAFERKIKSPFTLDDGTLLRKGSFIAAPAYHLGMDPELYKSPDQFDGLRFSKLRGECKIEDDTQFRYESLNESHIHFGIGRHACPGRFFAGVWTKLVLGFIALNYDIALPNASQGRPASCIINTFLEVPQSTRVLVRERST